MSDNSQASVKRRTRKKGDSSPSAGLSSKSKKVRRVDKSSRAKNRGKAASTPAKSPSKEASKEKSPSKEITVLPSKETAEKSRTLKKVDPEVLKAIRDGRENFVHIVRRGTKSTNFVFPPGRIYKHGTDPKTVPVVPTTRMKDEMRAMNERTGRKKSKQRKYLERTATTTASKEHTADTRNTDKSSVSRKKSRSKQRGRKKDTPIPPK